MAFAKCYIGSSFLWIYTRIIVYEYWLMNTVRNGIAHSRLDLNLEAVHLSDLKIIDTKSIQIGIKRLFGERISIE